MKAKLLKIVRKRYSIKKIVEVTNPDSNYRFCKTFPFWAIYEEGKLSFDCWNKALVFESYEFAYKKLVTVIHNTYYTKIKGDDDKIEKVWWNK